MKVRELIKQLESLYLDSQIYLWVDGERIEIDGIDDSFIDREGFADINGIRFQFKRSEA